MARERPVLGVVGAGKVGSTLARLLRQAGYEIACIHSRSPERAAALAALVGARAVARPGEVIACAELTILAVPDDAIEIVAAAIEGDLRGAAVIHTSGAHDLETLAPLSARGAMVGSLHPAFPFSDIEAAIRGLAGAAYAVEANDETLRDQLFGIVSALGGSALVIPPGKKVLYHSALVIVSNYLVTLYAIGERILTELGAEQSVANKALNALVLATADNLSRQGVPAALTGPLARADAGTVRAHLRALEDYDEEIVTLYKQLARLSFPMLAATDVPMAEIQRLLEEGKQDATDNTRY